MSEPLSNSVFKFNLRRYAVWTDPLSLAAGQWVYIEIDKPHGYGETWKEAGDLHLAVLMENTTTLVRPSPYTLHPTP
jgi:hypothetical protein